MVFVWTAISLSLTAVALWMSCAQIFSITSYVLQILHLHKKCAVVSRHRRSYVRWIFVTINPSDCTFHICFSLYISFHVVSFVQISNIFLFLFISIALPSIVIFSCRNSLFFFGEWLCSSFLSMHEKIYIHSIVCLLLLLWKRRRKKTPRRFFLRSTSFSVFLLWLF